MGALRLKLFTFVVGTVLPIRPALFWEMGGRRRKVEDVVVIWVEVALMKTRCWCW